MKKIEELDPVLPATIAEAFYEGEILVIHADHAILISIRCPFVLKNEEGTEMFPGGNASAIQAIKGRSLLAAATEVRGTYPDLNLHLSGGFTLSARPPHSGEEMWYIDVAGVAFITP